MEGGRRWKRGRRGSLYLYAPLLAIHSSPWQASMLVARFRIHYTALHYTTSNQELFSCSSAPGGSHLTSSHSQLRARWAGQDRPPHICIALSRLAHASIQCNAVQVEGPYCTVLQYYSIVLRVPTSQCEVRSTVTYEGTRVPVSEATAATEATARCCPSSPPTLATLIPILSPPLVGPHCCPLSNRLPSLRGLDSDRNGSCSNPYLTARQLQYCNIAPH